MSDAERAEPPRVFTVEDLWSLGRVGAPKVSPDGRQVAFAVTRFPRDENQGMSDLWLVPADGGAPPRRLTWDAGSDKGADWSSDGRHLVFASKRGDGPAQLYRLPTDGGEAEPLTDLPIAAGEPKCFPDGRRVAFVASTFPDLNDDFEAVKKRLDEAKEDKTQAKVTERRLLRYWDEYRTDGRVPHVFELDLESRAVRDLLPGFDALMRFMSFEWDLAPDGGEVAFIANSTDPPWERLSLDVYLLDVASGEVRRVTGGGVVASRDISPRYTADGRYLLFGRRPDLEDSAELIHLMRYDRESGELADLTAPWDAQPSEWTTTRDGRTVLLSAHDRGRRNLYALPVEPEDGEVPRLIARGGALGDVAAGEDGLLVFGRESFFEPCDLAALPLAGGEVRSLTALHRETLDGIDFGSVEDVTFTGGGGDEVQMWLLHPPGFTPERKWPLLFLLHGGPHNAWLDSFHYRWSAALFASRGYVVAALNFHGSTGFGQAFTASIQGEHAALPFADVMAATDLLLARGYVDEKRLAAAGGSFGGYLVAWILGHSDRFAALVNHAGVYDLMAQYASDYTWSRTESYGAEPWVDPDRIDLYSPSRFAKHFNTPTLLLHGELDYRVPVTQAINLHNVLTGKGVDSRIVVFPNENHWITRPQAAEVWWGEIFDWLEKYVGKGPTPEDEDDGQG